MRTFAEKPDRPQHAGLQRPTGAHVAAPPLHELPPATEDERASAPPRVADDFSRVPAHAGAHAVPQTIPSIPRVLRAGPTAASPPAGTATAIEVQGKTGAAEFSGEPMAIQPEPRDQTPAPLNEDGFIDGEWTSEVAAHAFVNGGKVGTAIVNWAGGAGGTTPGVGAVTTVAPVIDTSGPPAAGGTAQAWVRPGTGTATVSRSYTGVLVGANGAAYYITARAAARIDRHEENHIAHSRTNHNTHISPLETRVAQRTGQANALNQGATAAAAQTALESFLSWNIAITNFRNGDTADNIPGGAVDTADAATADFYHNYGPRAVGILVYANYIDTPPGP